MSTVSPSPQAQNRQDFDQPGLIELTSNQPNAEITHYINPLEITISNTTLYLPCCCTIVVNKIRDLKPGCGTTRIYFTMRLTILVGKLPLDIENFLKQELIIQWNTHIQKPEKGTYSVTTIENTSENDSEQNDKHILYIINGNTESEAEVLDSPPCFASVFGIAFPLEIGIIPSPIHTQINRDSVDKILNTASENQTQQQYPIKMLRFHMHYLKKDKIYFKRKCKNQTFQVLYLMTSANFGQTSIQKEFQKSVVCSEKIIFQIPCIQSPLFLVFFCLFPLLIIQFLTFFSTLNSDFDIDLVSMITALLLIYFTIKRDETYFGAEIWVGFAIFSANVQICLAVILSHFKGNSTALIVINWVLIGITGYVLGCLLLFYCFLRPPKKFVKFIPYNEHFDTNHFDWHQWIGAKETVETRIRELERQREWRGFYREFKTEYNFFRRKGNLQEAIILAVFASSFRYQKFKSGDVNNPN